METPSTQTPSGADTSFTSVLTNIFASPSEAFVGLAGQPVKHSRWLIPMFITIAIVIGSVFLIFSNETFSQQIQDAQAVSMDKAVDEGRMTREQADMALEQMEGGGGSMFIIFGSIFGGIFVALYYVLGALFLWLGAKVVLKSSESYGRHLEVYGLASWIGIIGSVITIVMMLALDSIYATPSAALAIYNNFDPANEGHKWMRAFDAFGAWQAVVAGFGISKVAGKDSTMGLVVAVVLWLIWVAISVQLGLAR
jgi:hypothetical protein